MFNLNSLSNGRSLADFLIEYWGFLVLAATFRNFLKKKCLSCHVLLEWKVAIPGEEEMIEAYQVVWSTLFGLCDILSGGSKIERTATCSLR